MTPWKHELKQAFTPPPPTGKREFLRRNTDFRMSTVAFLHSQLRYIKKWVWAAAIIIFAVSILGASVLSLNMLWIIAACSPILAMTILSESGRSERFRMEELELSTRFSLRSVILARFAILGAANLILLALLLPVGLLNNSFSPVAAGLYITTPFLLTVCIGILITRSFSGENGLYGCCGVSFFVSICVLLSPLQAPFLYLEQHLPWWAFTLAVLSAVTAKHSTLMIQQTEELSWN